MDRRLLILFITIFIDLMGFGIFVPVVPIYARELNASESLVGDTGALFSLMMFIFTPFWGTLSDRFGRRPVILIALAISAVSYVMFAHATTLAVLIISRMLTGVGSGNITAAQAYITDITPPEGRAKALGLIGAAFGIHDHAAGLSRVVVRKYFCAWHDGRKLVGIDARQQHAALELAKVLAARDDLLSGVAALAEIDPAHQLEVHHLRHELLARGIQYLWYAGLNIEPAPVRFRLLRQV